MAADLLEDELEAIVIRHKPEQAIEQAEPGNA
jgi:hypothetical protein